MLTFPGQFKQLVWVSSFPVSGCGSVSSQKCGRSKVCASVCRGCKWEQLQLNRDNLNCKGHMDGGGDKNVPNSCWF